MPHRREQQGAHSTDASSFGRRCHPDQDRAQHQHDKQERRQQHLEDPAHQLTASHCSALFGWHRGHAVGVDGGVDELPEDVEQHQRKARDQGADEKVGDGHRIGREVAGRKLRLLVGC